MSAYYNENDPKAAAWLRELISAGRIAPGDVDERSILEVRPHEITQYAQQHFFAGIGGWSYALRLTGWPDCRPVRTGSCPCQPFSQAGQQKGEADERHLWPSFRDLITFGEPTVTFGEQVASKLGRRWLSRVRADLEGLGYGVGAADLCAAGVGAPHIRQRLFWVADPKHSKRRPKCEINTESHGRNGSGGSGEFMRMADAANGRGPEHGEESRQRRNAGPRDPAERRCPCGLAYTGRPGDEPHGRSGDASCPSGEAEGEEREQWRWASACDCSEAGGMVQPYSAGRDAGRAGPETARHGGSAEPASRACGMGNADGKGRTRESLGLLGSGNKGAWGDYEIIPCRDGKARRIESGAFPLAHGVPGRVGLLRGYGNAIVPEVAAAFIQAYLEAVA